MANYQQAVKKVLKIEGGFQKQTSDTGNYNTYSGTRRIGWGKGKLAGTNYGISAAFYSAVLKREVSETDMRNITKQKAISLYKKYFWDAIKGDEIKHQELAELIFDAKVNMSKWGSLLQKSLNKIGFNLKVDGVVGKNTLLAVMKSDPLKLYNKYREYRIWWYKNKGQAKYRKGWLNRMKKFPILTNLSTIISNNNTQTNKPKEIVVTSKEIVVTASKKVKESSDGDLIGFLLMGLIIKKIL